ncbi:MAG: tRNA (adenosine(37)-N6)-threonylcarbamoyltransferase complex dimerization subunit type 1 TsaB [Terriglobia bacterium]
MLILAFDTTSPWGGAAIFQGEQCLASIRHEGPGDYSVSLFQAVEEMLNETGLSLRQIDLFATANGPGSFTGIRVGLAAAQGWSAAFGKPARGIGVLDAMIEEAGACEDYAAPVLDARRDQFYAEWRPSPALARSEAAPAEGGPQRASGCKPAAVVMGKEQLSDYLQAQLPPGRTLACIARREDARCRELAALCPLVFRWHWVDGFLVPAIARLALRAEFESRPVSPEELSAFYIRRSEAELHWKG